MNQFYKNILEKHKRKCRERTFSLFLVGIYAIIMTGLFMCSTVKLEADRHREQVVMEI